MEQQLARGPVVLVVDDTPQNLELVSDLLQETYVVKVANSGQRALTIARSEPPPDLILLDIMMPGMDGHDVCRQLKADARTSEIPVIFFTARGEAEDEEQGLAMGAVDYITKPISPPILLARVRTQLALKASADSVRDMHRFVSDSLDGLPDTALVCDVSGKVQLANRAAAAYFACQDTATLLDRDIVDLLRDVVQAEAQAVISRDRLAAGPHVIGEEAVDGSQRSLLVKCVPSFSAGNAHSGWIVTLTDLTVMREAERQRDEALRFITHDIRAPQAAILTLLELRRQESGAEQEEPVLRRIENHARKTLNLVDGFVQLARAKSSDYRLQAWDLVDLLDEAIDDGWSQARQRRVKLHVVRRPALALCEIERDLVLRAIGNLLGNAMKYGPSDAEVVCAIDARDGCWALTVSDRGPGVDAEQRKRLFQPYQRLHEGADGVGLGLVFVKTVANRHGGSVELDSPPGGGATFRLLLPMATDLDPTVRAGGDPAAVPRDLA
jgi:signal transduction histidine kinase